MLPALTAKMFCYFSDTYHLLDLQKNPLIQGFIISPSWMFAGGITNYEKSAKEITLTIHDKPLSLAVLADNFEEMKRQAALISQWGKNIYVEIPISNSRGIPSYNLIRKLANLGIKQNVAAVMTLDQVRDAAAALANGPPAYISVYANHIADTGHDPLPLMKAAVELVRIYPNIQLIWADTRELLNIVQANTIGCPIVATHADIINKLPLLGKNLRQYSIEIVKESYDKILNAGFSLATSEEYEIV